MKVEVVIPEGWRQLGPREFRKDGDKILSGHINKLEWKDVTCFIGKSTDNQIIIRRILDSSECNNKKYVLFP